MAGQDGITRLLFNKFQSAFLKQARQGGQPGGVDLFMQPMGLRGAGCQLEQRRLADEDQLVGMGKVLAEQAQFAQ